MDKINFFLWYQKPLSYLLIDECSGLILLFDNEYLIKDSSSCLNESYYSIFWCQNCLDFLYRTVVSGLCDFSFSDQTLHPSIDIMAREGAGTGNGYGTWQEYQIYLTEKGRFLLDECHVDYDTQEKSLLLKQKISKIFHDCGVGFDKKGFVKMKDYLA